MLRKDCLLLLRRIMAFARVLEVDGKKTICARDKVVVSRWY